MPIGLQNRFEQDLHGSQVRFSKPYLLVIAQIPLYQDASGCLFANELWQRDLLRHLEYLDHLIIACPCLEQEPPNDALPLNFDSEHKRVEVIALPVQKNVLHAIMLTPALVARLWGAIRQSAVVHSAVAGWPIPMAWFTLPIALLIGKRSVIVVESAPWRLQEGVSAGWKMRLRSHAQEYASRWLLSRTDLPIFTQEGYRQSLLGAEAGRGHVIPASWIDESDIIGLAEAERSWNQKLESLCGALQVTFAGRLTAEKGIRVLLACMRELAKQNVAVTLDILGEGPLVGECERAARELTGATRIRVLGSLPYGAPFFAALRERDAVVIPSISDEQPRIVFDAYSQGVPVIASDTTGLRSCVLENHTGLFAPANDHIALAALLQRAALSRKQLRELGFHALAFARTRTHQQMHRERADLLQRYFSATV